MNDDCDIFEIAQDLYATLGLAERALNQCRNTRINCDGYRDSYAVAAAVGKTLREYEDRI
jgi:hypothetical protein